MTSTSTTYTFGIHSCAFSWPFCLLVASHDKNYSWYRPWMQIIQDFTGMTAPGNLRKRIDPRLGHPIDECKHIFSRGGGHCQILRTNNHRSWKASTQTDPSVPTTYTSLLTKAFAGARHALSSRGVRSSRMRGRSPAVLHT